MFEHLDVAALFDNLAGDLMTQDQALRSGGASADHVLIGPADVGGHDLQNDAVRGVFPAERVRLALGHLELGVRDGLNLHLARLDISNSTISCHYFFSFFLSYHALRDCLIHEVHY